MDTAFHLLLLLGIVVGLLCVGAGVYFLSRKAVGVHEITLRHFGTVKTTNYGVVCLFFGAFFFASATVAYAKARTAENRIAQLKHLVYDNWTIDVNYTGLGKIQHRGANTNIQVIVSPPIWHVYEDGSVELANVPVLENRVTKELVFPKIRLIAPPDANGKYGNRPIDLNDQAIRKKSKIDPVGKSITVEGDYFLPYIGPYDGGTDATLQP